MGILDRLAKLEAAAEAPASGRVVIRVPWKGSWSGPLPGEEGGPVVFDPPEPGDLYWPLWDHYRRTGEQLTPRELCERHGGEADWRDWYDELWRSVR
jgi:hypothetical protein